MKEWLVTCVFPEPNKRGESAWGLAVGSQGELAGMIVGKHTRWVWNHSPILGGQWHHLAMSFDGADLMLYVDGKQSKQDETRTDPLDLGHKPGLLIGSQGAIVCEGLVRELKLSIGSRIPATTDDRLVADQQTIGLWRINDAGQMTDETGRCPSGVITAFERESLDDFEASNTTPARRRWMCRPKRWICFPAISITSRARPFYRSTANGKWPRGATISRGFRGRGSKRSPPRFQAASIRPWKTPEKFPIPNSASTNRSPARTVSRPGGSENNFPVRG